MAAPLRVKIRPHSKIAALAARVMKAKNIAIVFRNTIYLHNCAKEDFLQDKRWLRHEVAHVYQYRRLGFFPFLASYLAECIRKGYYNNKFEVEARASEQDEGILERVQVI